MSNRLCKASYQQIFLRLFLLFILQNTVYPKTRILKESIYEQEINHLYPFSNILPELYPDKPNPNQYKNNIKQKLSDSLYILKVDWDKTNSIIFEFDLEAYMPKIEPILPEPVNFVK